MKKLGRTRHRSASAGTAALAIALTSISAYAFSRSDLYVLRRPQPAAAGASDDGDLYRVDESTGAYSLVRDGWGEFSAIVSDGGSGAYVAMDRSINHISFIDGNEGSHLDTAAFTTWLGPTQLAYGKYVNGAATVESLIAWHGGRLYRVNTNTQTVALLGPAVSSGQSAMVYLNHNNNSDGNDLYLIRIGLLWRVNVLDGTYTQVGGGNWFATTAMTTDGTTLYVACQNHLYKANPTTGSSTDLGPAWNSTTSLTFFNGGLYAIDGGDLFKVNTSTGSTTLLGSANEWPGMTMLTYRSY